MPNAEKAHPNRRREQRVPLHDLMLKIRKTGLGMPSYELCRSVDLSLNGLSFYSDTLTLKVPEKVDFMLNIEDHEIKGTGVVCNRRDAEKGTQYGLMFISVSPEISSIFNDGELSTRELENLAKNMAEQFVLSLSPPDAAYDRDQQLKQQQLFDACRCYLLRLGEMGLRMYNSQQQLLQPIQVIRVFRDKHGAIVMQWYSSASKNTKQLVVKIDNENLSNTFIVDNVPIKTVLQVLNVLGERIHDEILFI